MWDRRARVDRVKDGDTLVVVLDQGFNDTKQIDLRLLGVYAPELHDVNGGAAAKAYVEKWLDTYGEGIKWPFIVTTARTNDHETKTFDRYVCTLTTIDGSRSLNIDVQQYVIEQHFSGGIGS